VSRERILTRELRLLLAGLILLFLGTTLLVPVLPAVMARSGGASGAGLVTALFYFPAVATQLRMPHAMTRYPARTLLVVAFVLMGAPCFAYAAADGSVGLILAATAVRGVGFGIATVASGTLIAQLAPPRRRGTVIGYAGLASGIPPVFAPAAGVSLLDHGGASAVFLIAGGLGLAGALLSVLLEQRPAAGRERPHGLLHAAREQALAWPFSWFLLVSLTRGASLSFASLWLVRGGLASAASFLLAFGTFAYLARWGGGRLADRSGTRVLVLPGALAALAGLVLLASGNGPGLVVVAAGVLFGAGYGLLQSASQLDMLARGGSDGFAVATTAFNIAIDCGVGLGGVLLGLVAAAAGYATAFWVLPGVMTVALGIMLAERRPSARAS
jgi:predicted MFS family arabinose efflux permease